MSSNGLATSRWANVDVVTAPTDPNVSWVGLASSRWADSNATDWSDTSSVEKYYEDESDDEYHDEEDPAVAVWREWVHDSRDRIRPSELDSYFETPALLFNLRPLPAPLCKNLQTALIGIWGFDGLADEQLKTELTAYLESFSSPALKILSDQLDTYLGRLEEDEEQTREEYDGKYGRECGLWTERLRMRDLRGELAEFAITA